MTDQEKVIDRLRKLKAMAEDKSTTEEEAQAFAAKFQEVMAKHKLDMSDVEWEEHVKETEVVRVYVSHRAAGLKTSKVRASWMIDLAIQIGNSQNCRVLLIRSNRDFYFVGEPEDAEAAKQVYGYMVKVAENLATLAYTAAWKRHAKEGDVTQCRGFRRSFLFGFTKRLQERYAENQRKLEQEYAESALMRISNALKRAQDSINADSKTKKVNISQQQSPENLEGFFEGVKTADNVKFNAPQLN